MFLENNFKKSEKTLIKKFNRRYKKFAAIAITFEKIIRDNRSALIT